MRSFIQPDHPVEGCRRVFSCQATVERAKKDRLASQRFCGVFEHSAAAQVVLRIAWKPGE